MLTFENGIDLRCRKANTPTVARLHVGRGEYRFIVIGTPYGYWHTTGGDIRTWKTYGGARRAALRYVPV